MLSRLLALAALLLPTLPLAADAPEAYRCEARGGRAWRELRSAHFVIATDLSVSRSEALVRDLEQLHGLVLQAIVGEQVDIPGKLRVVAFSDPRDFQRLAPHDEIMGVFTTDSLGRPTIVFSVEGMQADPHLIAHELTHHVSWHLFPRQPSWFAEGLAQFVQTVARPRERALAPVGSNIVPSGPSGGRWAGLVPPDLVRFLREAGGGMPEDLLRWPGPRSGEVVDRYYAWSWLLYHWIWNTRPKAFTDFTTRLANAEAPAAAWRAAFPDLDPAAPGGTAALSEELERYRRGGRFTSYEVKAPAEARAESAPLPPAEAHAVVYEARGIGRDAANARAELDEAAREDPTHPVAAWHAARKGDAAATMRKVTAARPDDWRGWYLLAGALHDAAGRPEKEAALRKAVALEPNASVARNDLAWLLYESGRAREALPHANAAVDLAPWNPSAIDTLASVAADLGKCREALVLQNRAADLARSDERRRRFEARLAELEKRCAAGAAAGAAR